MAKKTISGALGNLGKTMANMFGPKTPSGPEDNTEEIKEFLESIKMNMSMSYASFFLGNSAKGLKDTSFLGATKSNKNSILGENKSIYSLLEDIKKQLDKNTKESPIVSMSENIKKLQTSFKKYPDDIEEILESSLKTLNKEDSENKEEGELSNEVKLIISGLDGKGINGLIELAKMDSDKVSQGLKNLLEAIKPFNELKLDEKIIQNHVSLIETIMNKVNTVKVPDNEKQVDVIESIQAILGILGSLETIGKMEDNSDKAKTIIVNYLKALQESYAEVEKSFNQIIAISTLADQSKSASAKIKEGLDACNQTAIETANNESTLKASNRSMSELTGFMIAAAAVMMIGALFMELSNGKMFINALKFGAALMAFEALVLAPILIFSKMKGEVAKGLEDFSDFVIVCAGVMMVGALFMHLSGGKMFMNALKFGLVLGLFEALVLAPILIFSRMKGEVIQGLKDFSGFIIVCTAVMLIGALFMGLAGGKLVINALAFGLTLGLFEALVLAPILAFNKMEGEVMQGLKDFSGFLITCTIVMLIGALFIELGGGKFVLNALAFGFVLGMFEAMVIAPFLLFNLIDRQVFQGLKAFSGTLITCTVVLLIGALFMQLGGGKFVKAAMKFTVLLMAFEAAVIAPILLFNLAKPVIFSGLKDFSTFLITVTACLLIGALFMTLKNGTMPKYAMEFTGVFASFIAAIGVAIIPLMKWLKPAVMEKMHEFNLFLAISSACLVIGSLYIYKFGTMSALKYVGVFELFILGMGKVAKTIVELFDKKTLDSLKPFSIFLGTMHAILITGGLFTKKYGATIGAKYAAVFDLFVWGMAKVSKNITDNFDKTKLDSLIPFSIFLGTMHAVLVTGAMFMDKYGNTTVSKYGIAITTFIYGILPAMAAVIAITTIAKISQMNAILAGGGSLGFTIPAGGGGMTSFFIFVGLMHAVLLTGSMFVHQFGVEPIGQYGICIAGFIYTMVGALALFNKVDIKEKKLTDFIIFVGALHAIILTGALFINQFGTEDVVTYGIILTTFVGAMTGIFYLLSKSITNKVEKDVLIFAAMVGIFHAIVLSAVLAVRDTFDIVAVGEYLAVLGLFTTGMVFLFKALQKHMQDITKGALAMLAISGSMLVFSGVIFLITKIFEKKNPDEVLELVGGLALISGALGLFYGVIGSFAGNVALGSLVMLAVSASFGIYSLIISMIVDMFRNTTMEEILGCTTNLILSAGELSLFFGIVGIPPFALLVSLGSAAIAAMALALQQYVKGLGDTINLLAPYGDPKNYDDSTVHYAIEYLSKANEELTELFESFGFFAIKVRTGAKAITSISTGIQHINEAFESLTNGYASWGNSIVEAIVTTHEMISDQLVPMYNDICNNSPQILVTSLATVMMRGIAKDINSIVEYIVQSVDKISKAGDITDNIQLVIDNISKYFSIPDQVSLGGLWGAIGLKLKLIALKELSHDIAQIIGEVGDAVAHIASLEIPWKYDEKGRVVKYRQLRESDFDLAGENVGKILMTMADALNKVWDGGDGKQGLKEMYGVGAQIGEFFGIDSPLTSVMNFGMDVSKVLSGVGESVGMIAKMQIPTKWDEHGKPIAFRQLKEKDFTMAGEGVGFILTHMATVLGDIYKNGWIDESGNIGNTSGKYNIFDRTSGGFLGMGEDPSPIEKVLGASFQISEILANIGEGVGKIAKLQIPTAWDTKTGKVTNYRTLKEQDFRDMGNGVSTILTSIFNALINDVYKGNEELFKEISGGLFSSDKPSPMMTVLEASAKVSEIISNTAKGISQMAKMQIPDKWDEKGKPIHYKELTKEDFTKAGESIGSIVKCVVDKLITFADDPVFKDDTFKHVMESVMPISELISNMAEGVLKLASGQIPSKWNDQGKPIEFKKIEPADYAAAGVTVGVITTSIAQTLLDLVKNDQYKDYFFDENGKPSEKMQVIVESFSGISGLVTDMADAVVKLGQGLVADQWKDGKPTHYKPIDFVKIIPSMQQIVEKITTSIAETLISIVQAHPDYFGKENTKFQNAVESIQGTTKIVTDLVDTVIKIGSAQIPVHWDEHGKPDRFISIEGKIDTAIENTKKIFSETIGGLLGTIQQLWNEGLDVPGIGIIKIDNANTWKKWIDDTVDISQSIVSMISSLAECIINVSSLKIPTGFDESGKAKGYILLKDNDINNASNRITQMITSLLGIFYDNPMANADNSTITISSILSNQEQIKNNATNIKSTAIKIFDTVDEIASRVSELMDSKESIDTLFDYKQKSHTDKAINDSIQIGFFRDIAVLITDISQLMSLFNGVKDNILIENELSDSFFNITKQDLDANKIKNNIKSIFSIVSSIIGQIDSLDETVIGDNNKINLILGKDQNKTDLVAIVTSILNIYISIDELLNKIPDVKKEKIFKTKTYITYISLLNDILNDLLKNVNVITSINVSQFKTLSSNLLTSTISNIGAFYSNIISAMMEINSNTENSINGGMKLQALSMQFKIMGSLFTDLFSNIELLTSIDVSKMNDLDSKSLTSTISNIGAFYNDIIQTILEINESIDGSAKSTIMSLNVQLLETTMLVTEIFENMSKAYLTFYSNVDNFNSTISGIFSQLDVSNSSLDIAVYKLKDNVQVVLDTFNSIDLDTNLFGKTDLAKMTDDLDYFITNIAKFNEQMSDNANKLKSSIDNIYQAVSNQKTSKVFKDNTSLLEKYVKTINSINIKSTNAFTELVKQLNMLAAKLGNVDKLTDVMANRLSVVLDHLVKRLEESKEAIDKADEIQTKRHNLINESIQKVKDLMENPLSITITQDMSNMTMGGGSSESGGNTNAGGGVAGNGTGSPGFDIYDEKSRKAAEKAGYEWVTKDRFKARGIKDNKATTGMWVKKK